MAIYEKTKNTKFKEAGDSRYIYQNELDKACFQHVMACGDFNDLSKRTASDKILRDRAFNIANIDGHQCRLNSMSINFLIKSF